MSRRRRPGRHALPRMLLLPYVLSRSESSRLNAQNDDQE